MVLTENEKVLFSLKVEGATDYKIARKLRMETPCDTL
jgi:hypothetical protein